MRKFLSLALAVTLAAYPAGAAAPAAVFHGNGQVTVNGSEVSRSTTVFSGDQIRTTDGAGTITAPGASVLVHKSSQVVFGKDAIDVLAGGATVKTTSALVGHIGGLTVRPVNAASRYTLTSEANKIYISALQGSLQIGQLTIPEGKMAVFNATAPAAQSDCVDNKKVDSNGKFVLDNVGRFIPCVEQNTTAGGAVVDTTNNHIGTYTAIGFGAAAAAGGISAGIISQEKKTDQ